VKKFFVVVSGESRDVAEMLESEGVVVDVFVNSGPTPCDKASHMSVRPSSPSDFLRPANTWGYLLEDCFVLSDMKVVALVSIVDCVVVLFVIGSDDMF
jgi:hypothetical protein